MNVELQKRLLKVEGESFEPGDAQAIVNDLMGEYVFGRFCHEILAVYRDFFPGITVASVSVAGLEPGQLTPIAALPAGFIDRLDHIDRKLARELARDGFETIDRPAEHPLFRRSPIALHRALAIRLVGYDEYYGVLAFGAESEGGLSSERRDMIVESIPLLNRLMAEANFSMRLKALAAPFEFAGGTVSRVSMYQQIASRTCRGLAADGSVLRIRERNPESPRGYALEFKSRAGNVTDAQIALGRAGERICQRVFESLDSFVTVQTLQANGTRFGFGVPISDEDDAELRSHGVQAYMIMKVQSDINIDGRPAVLGTLSAFHRLPQVFSLRDISLFRSFCERVGDDLALLDQRDENEAMNELLRAQDRLGTRAEITALLGHDFGHRVFHVGSALEDFIDNCGGALREGSQEAKNFPRDSQKLRESCAELRDIVRQLRSLGQGVEEAPIDFDVSDVFAEIDRTLHAVLERYHMALEVKSDGNSRTRGVKSILLQALFNLVINAIDAQRSSERRKLNTVHMTCRELGSGAQRQLEIKVWDEGSGISRSKFPDPQRIFDVGTTSKPPGQGTGTGLPVARSLLDRYFHADLLLKDRYKALFQFSIPSPLHKQMTATAEAPPRRNLPATIFVVDDDPVVLRRVEKESLCQTNLGVMTAGDLPMARRLIQADYPIAAVLADLHFRSDTQDRAENVHDGLEFLKRVQDEDSEIPLYVFSMDSEDRAHRARAEKMGLKVRGWYDKMADPARFAPWTKIERDLILDALKSEPGFRAEAQKKGENPTDLLTDEKVAEKVRTIFNYPRLTYLQLLPEDCAYSLVKPIEVHCWPESGAKDFIAKAVHIPLLTEARGSNPMKAVNQLADLLVAEKATLDQAADQVAGYAKFLRERLDGYLKLNGKVS